MSLSLPLRAKHLCEYRKEDGSFCSYPKKGRLVGERTGTWQYVYCFKHQAKADAKPDVDASMLAAAVGKRARKDIERLDARVSTRHSQTTAIRGYTEDLAYLHVEASSEDMDFNNAVAASLRPFAKIPPQNPAAYPPPPDAYSATHLYPDLSAASSAPAPAASSAAAPESAASSSAPAASSAAAPQDQAEANAPAPSAPSSRFLKDLIGFGRYFN